MGFHKYIGRIHALLRRVDLSLIRDDFSFDNRCALAANCLKGNFCLLGLLRRGITAYLISSQIDFDFQRCGLIAHCGAAEQLDDFTLIVLQRLDFNESEMD